MDIFCDICATSHAFSRDDGALFGDPVPARVPVDLATAVRDLDLIPINVRKRIEEEWMGETPPA